MNKEIVINQETLQELVKIKGVRRMIHDINYNKNYKVVKKNWTRLFKITKKHYNAKEVHISFNILKLVYKKPSGRYNIDLKGMENE